MIRLRILLLCLVGLGLALAAHGESTPPVLTPEAIQVADANHDGHVTFAEAQALVPMLTEEAFARLDANHDGYLSPADLPQAPPEHKLTVQQIVEAADANHDGSVTFEEAKNLFPNVTFEQFKHFDLNNDDVISAADSPSAPPHPLEALLHFLRTADADQNGAITYEEAKALVPALTQEQFDYLDNNGDGVLTRDDLPAAPPEDPVRRLLNLLRQLDTNHDNAVSYEEILAWVPSFPQEAFDVLDVNGDGVLTLADLPEGPKPYEELLALLRQADVNHDEQVTFEELQAVVPQISQEQFDHLDRNGDGVISREDFQSAPPENLYLRILRLFKEADANGDKQLTLDELQAVIPTFTQHAFDYVDRNDDGVISEADLPSGPPPGDLEVLMHLLRMADENDNGEVTFDELAALVPDLTQEQFDHLDRNADGVISKADLPSFPDDPQKWLIQLLRQADANGDSKVTFDEMKALLPLVTQEQFDKLDRNGDGVISVEDKPEVPIDPQELLIALLHKADVNGNNEVTFDELKAVYTALTQEQFNHLDRNGDGVISKADLPQAPEDPRDRILRFLQEADTDGNGEVDFYELQAVAPDVTRERFDELDRNGDGVLSAADLPDSPIPPDDDARLELLHALVSADQNGDGQLDYREIAAAFPNAPAELLGRIDADGNWIITRDELRNAIQRAYNGGYIVPEEDIDASGKVDAVDVQVVINHALGRLGKVLLADLDGDNHVTAVDVQKVINGVLRAR
jgi:Ca2+-binding EF-hand superfamily protein